MPQQEAVSGMAFQSAFGDVGLNTPKQQLRNRYIKTLQFNQGRGQALSAQSKQNIGTFSGNVKAFDKAEADPSKRTDWNQLRDVGRYNMNAYELSQRPELSGKVVIGNEQGIATDVLHPIQYYNAVEGLTNEGFEERARTGRVAGTPGRLRGLLKYVYMRKNNLLHPPAPDPEYGQNRYQPFDEDRAAQEEERQEAINRFRRMPDEYFNNPDRWITS